MKGWRVQITYKNNNNNNKSNKNNNDYYRFLVEEKELQHDMGGIFNGRLKRERLAEVTVMEMQKTVLIIDNETQCSKSTFGNDATRRLNIDWIFVLFWFFFK